MAASVNPLEPGDRPREKFVRVGASGLGDNELLALVLGHGTPAMSALELATALLARSGGPRGLLRLTEVEASDPHGRRRCWPPSNWGAGP